MENKIHVVSSSEKSDIKKIMMKDEALFVAEIRSSNVRDLQDFFRTMSELFEFPIPSRTYAGFSDWMTDLDWLHKDGYVLVIYQYQDFMSADQAEKQEVIDVFATDILPFWQKEVVEVVVGGEVKPFHVYLVDQCFILVDLKQCHKQRETTSKQFGFGSFPGYVYELEIFRADSEPILVWPDVSEALITSRYSIEGGSYVHAIL